MLFTQTGSRFIQKQLSEDNDEGIKILNTILTNCLTTFFLRLQFFVTFLNSYFKGSTSIEEMRAKNEENRIMIHNFTTFILEEIGEKVNELMIDR